MSSQFKGIGIPRRVAPDWPTVDQTAPTAAQRIAEPWEATDSFPKHTVLTETAATELAFKALAAGVVLAAGAALVRKVTQAS